MGFILQTQRRAIEAVFERRIINLRGADFFLEDLPLKLIGVSEGVGTCSDKKFHGINIAVFRKAADIDGCGIDAPPDVNIEGAVLLRKRADDEVDDSFSDMSVAMAVEGLTLKSRDDDRIIFASNGRTKLYIPL